MRRVFGFRVLAVAIGIAAGLLTATLPVTPAGAKAPGRSAAKYIPPQYAAIVIDAETGAVLHAVDADQPTHPASLTKMMTLYLTFEALSQHRLQLEHRFPISEHAASMAPSKLSLKPGTSIRVEDLILAVVTKSANDAAAVLAEGLGGTEDDFAATMTMRARQLGMTHTHFENASGLPDPDQVTTAHDMALLGRALVNDFPTYYPYFSTRSFVFQGHVQTNHNHLLETYDGADGIKTGFIRASGFNLVASAKRDGHRLIGVVFGGRTQPWRDQQMVKLLDEGFAHVGAGGPAVANIADARINDTMPGQGNLVRLSLDATAAADDDADEIAKPVAKPKPVSTMPLVLVPGPRPVGHATTKLASADPAPALTALSTGNWLVQVGAFSGAAQASAASKAAQKSANLYAGQVSVSALPQKHGMLYRARIVGLAETQAREACRALTREHKPCVVLRPDGATAH